MSLVCFSLDDDGHQRRKITLHLPSMRCIPSHTDSMVTQVLGGMADTVAQTITAVRSRMKPTERSAEDVVSIEFQDLDKEKPPAIGELGHYKNAPAPFDFERLTRFMAYGFFMAPIQFQWFGFLSRIFPITKTHANIPALKRVAMDQLIFAPVGRLLQTPHSPGNLC